MSIFRSLTSSSFFCHVPSGHVTWEMPPAGGRSRDEICAELQRIGAIPMDAVLTPSGVRTCLRKFWLKTHPDKGGVPPSEEVKDLFKVVIGMDAAAAGTTSSAAEESSVGVSSLVLRGASTGVTLSGAPLVGEHRGPNGHAVGPSFAVAPAYVGSVAVLDDVRVAEEATRGSKFVARGIIACEFSRSVAEETKVVEGGSDESRPCKRRWRRRDVGCVKDVVAADDYVPEGGARVVGAVHESVVAVAVADGEETFEQGAVGGVGARVCSRTLIGHGEVVDCFDELAQMPRGPKRYHKDAPQSPCCVYSRDGGSIYVCAFAAAQDADWLEPNCVGLVVSVLGAKQRCPRVPRRVTRVHYCSDRWSDVEQWRALVEAILGTLSNGDSVLIHCMAGIHRAPVCAAGALAILCQMSFQRAYRLVVDSGRYVEPANFQKYVGHEVMRALLLCVADVRRMYVGRVRFAEEESDAAEELRLLIRMVWCA